LSVPATSSDPVVALGHGALGPAESATFAVSIAHEARDPLGMAEGRDAGIGDRHHAADPQTPELPTIARADVLAAKVDVAVLQPQPQ
jgi:hypothetical protein